MSDKNKYNFLGRKESSKDNPFVGLFDHDGLKRLSGVRSVRDGLKESGLPVPDTSNYSNSESEVPQDLEVNPTGFEDGEGEATRSPKIKITLEDIAPAMSIGIEPVNGIQTKAESSSCEKSKLRGPSKKKDRWWKKEESSLEAFDEKCNKSKLSPVKKESKLSPEGKEEVEKYWKAVYPKKYTKEMTDDCEVKKDKK